MRGKSLPIQKHSVSGRSLSPSPPAPLPQGRGEEESPSPPAPLPQGRGEKSKINFGTIESHMQMPLPIIAELLAELVRIPSINPMGRGDIAPELSGEARMIDQLEAILNQHGVTSERQAVAPNRDNLIARFVPANPIGKPILWEAHQDTVPVDGMTIDPFAATIENGKLYGRGACDVKAGTTAMLAAFLRLIQESPANARPITLAFTVDEEHTFLGVQTLAASNLDVEFAIIAEPTGLNIVHCHKGVIRWSIETQGIAGHSSRPEQGVNAIYRMGQVVSLIEEFAEQLAASDADAVLGPPTLSVGIIDGGVSPNTIPDQCMIELDRRLLPSEEPMQTMHDLEQFLRSRIDFDIAVSLPHFVCPALGSTGSEPLVHNLGTAIDAVVGQHEVMAVGYGTDASTLYKAGIPSVVFGPGSIEQAHTKDEWVELKQVEQAAEILFRFATHQPEA